MADNPNNPSSSATLTRFRRILRINELSQYILDGASTYREQLLIQVSFWLSAIAVGVAAYYLGRLVELLQERYLVFFKIHSLWMFVITPFAFWLGTGVCKWFAPHAGGSGIPQVLYAAAISRNDSEAIIQSKMVSVRTSLIKVVSVIIGFLGGASLGAEGPTVQISATLFAASARALRKVLPKLDMQSYLVAGAGAGIAAAFNTPLGGIAFAIEEVALSEFGNLKHLVMLAVIISGLAAQVIAGSDTLYFGNPLIGNSQSHFLIWAIVIGVMGGILGALFGKIVTYQKIYRSKLHWAYKALICGVLVAVANYFFGGYLAGSGYQGTRALIDGHGGYPSLFFPLAKLLTTALSTISGLGGGILAPSLSIGAWMGVTLAKLLSFPNFQLCALLGMVAYLSGAFQMPLTAILIVIEMTDQHGMVLPLMLSGLCAYVVSKRIMPVSLYHLLIQRLVEYDKSLNT